MKELSIDEIRGLQLEILSLVHDLCIEEGLKYSLAGGTMLGAVRHNGYIPWDDDIDIMMRRRDYIKLLDVIESRHSKLQVHAIDRSGEQFFPCIYSKVAIKNTTVIEKNNAPYLKNIGINIDVFPLDGAGNSTWSKIYEFMVVRQVIRVIAVMSFPNEDKSFFKQLLVNILKPFNNVIISISQKIYKRLVTTEKEKKPNTASFGSVYGSRDVFDSSIYNEYQSYAFEGHEFMGIKNSDVYLSTLYGNYMSLPPEKDRINHGARAFVQ